MHDFVSQNQRESSLLLLLNILLAPLHFCILSGQQSLLMHRGGLKQVKSFTTRRSIPKKTPILLIEQVYLLQN